MVLVNHVWIMVIRLAKSRFEAVKISRAGKMIAGRINGMPNSWGIENWSNRLRVMVRFMCWSLIWLRKVGWGCLEER